MVPLKYFHWDALGKTGEAPFAASHGWVSVKIAKRRTDDFMFMKLL
jgi:hypothetical protein